LDFWFEKKPSGNPARGIQLPFQGRSRLQGVSSSKTEKSRRKKENEPRLEPSILVEPFLAENFVRSFLVEQLLAVNFDRTIFGRTIIGRQF
jgi:hypothetical protein